LLVERQIATRGAESTDPIPVGDVPAEVLPLVHAMNDLISRMRAAAEHQRRFIADAAHELRTPLAALQIQIDNLAAAELSSRAQSLGEIRAGIRRTARLVDQLLRMARLEEGQPSTREGVDLTAIVTQCVADFVPIAVARGVDLGMVASDRVTVTGTANDLKMLFGNLIENAIRYTPGGGTIDVSIHRAGLFTAIEIADTGCGIAEENMPRVFNRFFRAAADDSDGSGLGLSIVAAVARHHGFRVVLQNRGDRPGLRARILINHPENAPLIPG
jgi:two-component system OmpR family sensor kinase